MYTDRTADDILADMKEAVRDDVDKREGSIVHDMLAPPAQEHEMIGYILEAILELGFADTSQAEYLERRTAEQYVDREDAVAATGALVITGDNGTELLAGTRIPLADGTAVLTTEYSVIANGAITVPAVAEIPGEAGNIAAGALFVPDVPGVASVSNTVAFSGGVDIESDEDLKARYFLRIRKPITSGNEYHYQLMATSVAGVSAARVYPLWNGNGTVKVVVLDTNGRAPAQTIVDAVLARIQAERIIGATPTVIAVTEVPINIAATVTLAGGLLPADVQAAVVANISAYLAQAGTLVRYSQVANAIIDTENVLDYSGLTINGSTANVTINADSVAIVGTVTLT
jgi:uncharacterized phage protein gp47/JayE